MDQAPAPLTPGQIRETVHHLRLGRTATDAADALGVKPAAVYAAALTDPDVLLALAGHDPYGQNAPQIIQQADYLRLLALGFKPTEAERVLWHGGERVKKWRQHNSAFAKTADTVQELQSPEITRRREHTFSPERVKVFLETLANGTTVIRAAEEAGITTAVVYQRRRRDAAFRARMDAVRATVGRIPEQRAPITPEQWDAFRTWLTRGATLRRAAHEAGMHPATVYKRRNRSSEFREETDRMRGRQTAAASLAP